MTPSAPLSAVRAIPRALRSAGGRVWDQVRQQFITRNRRVAAGLALAAIVIAIGAVHVSAWWFSPGALILPILCGGLLLWPRALRILFGVVAAGLIYDVIEDKAGAGIAATIAVTAIFADVLANTRGKLGTRGLRADRMMIELRDRIRAQGTLPDLGDGWGSAVVLRPAGGSSFGGDFVVSYSDGKTLEVALVDVSGKGMDAATRALLLSGAFGGMLGSVARERFLPACNAYLRRGKATEGFVTAVHLTVDLASGDYTLASAGHPPAVRFDANTGRWRVSSARGIVLGVVPDLAGAHDIPDEGVLRRGDAIMLYTDGLVEARRRDIDEGIERLLGEAERLVVTGFQTGAPELVTTMQRTVGSSDDCALVVIWRSLTSRLADLESALAAIPERSGPVGYRASTPLPVVVTAVKAEQKGGDWYAQDSRRPRQAQPRTEPTVWAPSRPHRTGRARSTARGRHGTASQNVSRMCLVRNFSVPGEPAGKINQVGCANRLPALASDPFRPPPKPARPAGTSESSQLTNGVAVLSSIP